jgi:pyruvate,water dikinase
MITAGLPVPPGFVVTTTAFESIIGQDEGFRQAVSKLNECASVAALSEGATTVRNAVMACALPEAFARDVIQAWETITQNAPVAVRSSATAEDLANASFAGQQDTFLSIETQRELIEALRGCWASLFTERAVVYRRTHGFGNAQISMAVVVQRMVQADAAGVLFTADPLSGQRGISVIEAVAGLGEALVSGHVTPERYRIRGRDGVVLKRLSTKGEPLKTNQGVVSERALHELNVLARKVEANAKCPMDVEWAIERNRVWLLQARPITTLWPLPEGKPLPGWRIYLSFGHIQVYTAPISRVGISMFRRIAPLRRDPLTGMSTLVRNVGERVYMDVTPALSRQPFRTLLPKLLRTASEPIAERLKTAAEREELRNIPDGERADLTKIAPIMIGIAGRSLRSAFVNPHQERDAYVRELEEIIRHQSERLADANNLEKHLDILFDDFGTLLVEIMKNMIPCMLPAMIMTKIVPLLSKWIAPDIDHRLLLKGLEGNITTEMDMALADLGDIARDEPLLAAALKSENLVAQIDALRSDMACEPFFRGWDVFLSKYGHRCAGEIDPGVPRWREDPRIPLRSIAGALERPKGALREQHQLMTHRALECRDQLITAAKGKPFGFLLAPFTTQLVDRMRLLLGAREHHKYFMVLAIDRLRTVVLAAGSCLQRARALKSSDDIWFLELPEIRDAVKEVGLGRVPALQKLVEERRALRDKFANMSPPAVLTSDGESIAFVDKRDLPANSLAGTAVSGGIYEGVARVVHDPGREELGAGEILVAQFTDPGWTPLFGHAGALVMEVGGQMTHGSVIAREIGIPAVVAVEGATSRIRSGDRIRVDGERGFVTILEGIVS